MKTELFPANKSLAKSTKLFEEYKRPTLDVEKNRRKNAHSRKILRLWALFFARKLGAKK